MTKQKYIYWKHDNSWLGYFEEFPDYWTQGETEAELKENLIDLYKELSGGAIPNVRKLAEIDIA
jgi:predicted RNase H-like HicB family nuclease